MTIRTFAKGAFAAVLAVAVIAPSLVLAQSALTANIVAPANGATFEVGEAIQFTGSATGGSGQYTFAWTWGDGTGDAGASETHSYNTDGAKTVTLDVQDEINTTSEATRSITINIVPATGECTPLIVETPVESQPKATNVTQNSATIVWTTCEAATSRVVYGTVQVSDEVANDDSSNLRGYQSTTLLDETKVTSHSVNLSGLTPNTTYYFRVLSSRD